MSCNFDQEKILAYVLGLLEAREKALVVEHLKVCLLCQAEADKHQQAMAWLNQTFQEMPSEQLRQQTLAQIRHKARPQTRWLIWGVPVLASAAVLMLMFVMQPSWIRQLVRPTAMAEKRIQAPAAESRIEIAAITDRSQTKHAPAARLLADKKADTAAETGSAADNIIVEEFNAQLANPIDDRSIYEDLGVATEVAKLLL